MIPKRYLVMAVLLVVLVGGFWAKEKLTLAAKAFVYGYPLVLMHATKEAMIEQGLVANRLHHVQRFPDHSFRNVVRPNTDTLYSVAWLTLDEEPMVLSIPDIGERYFVMPFMDAFTNVFASVGTRTQQAQAGDYLITGPDWQAANNTGLQEIKAPTNTVWLIGRIQTNGQQDITSVSALQNQFALSTLTEFRAGKRLAGHALTHHNNNPGVAYKLEQMSSMDFFGEFGSLLKNTRTPNSDQDLIQRFAAIGISLEHGFQPETLNGLERRLLNYGMAIAKRRLHQALDERVPNKNGWHVIKEEIGRYADNYPLRASVAMVGLGALPSEEASYPSTSIDSEGEQLSGKNDYTLRFEAEQLPPARAFWSLALYNSEGYFVDNPIQRYSLGDRDALTFNADGSLTLHIQHDAPSQNESNWLPSPEGEFTLTLRLYLPEEEFLDGRWVLPAITKTK